MNDVNGSSDGLGLHCSTGQYNGCLSPFQMINNYMWNYICLLMWRSTQDFHNREMFDMEITNQTFWGHICQQFKMSIKSKIHWNNFWTTGKLKRQFSQLSSRSGNWKGTFYKNTKTYTPCASPYVNKLHLNGPVTMTTTFSLLIVPVGGFAQPFLISHCVNISIQ